MAIKRTQADIYFSLYIRAKAYWSCERCGRGYRSYVKGGDNSHLKALDCAHCHGRGSKMTRFEPDNAASLCYGCHSYLDAHPKEKQDFFIKRLGEDRYWEVHRLSKKPYRNFKKEQKEISKKYKKLFEELI